MSINYVKVADLPIGSKIIIGKNKFTGKYQNGEEDIIWLVVSNNHHTKDSGYPQNAVTLITKDVIRYMAFDAKEPLNTLESRRNFGNSRWRTSNIRQWLNSDGYAGQWYTPQNIGVSGSDNKDTAPKAEYLLNITRNYPYDTDEGFMRFFSASEKRFLLPATVKTVISTDSEGVDPMNPNVETTNDYFYLPSLTEVTGANFVYAVNYPMEGARLLTGEQRNAKATNLSLINGAFYSYAIGTNKDYAYRTSANNSELLKYFDDGGNGSYSKVKPYDNVGVRPMTNIKSDAIVVETSTTGVYRLVDNAKPYVIVNSLGTDTNGYDLNFNTYDYDDFLATVTIQIGNELVKTYNLGNVKNYEDTYVIPYEKLGFGVNTVVIKATDTRGEFSTKTLNLELKSRGAVKNGDIIATKDGLYTVIDTFINKKGDLELTLDRNLKSTELKTDKVEKYEVRYEPYAYVNNDYQQLPQYTKMELKSIDYQEDGTAIEEWHFAGLGNTVHTKVELSRTSGNTQNSELKKISQMFTFYDED